MVATMAHRTTASSPPSHFPLQIMKLVLAATLLALAAAMHGARAAGRDLRGLEVAQPQNATVETRGLVADVLEYAESAGEVSRGCETPWHWPGRLTPMRCAEVISRIGVAQSVAGACSTSALAGRWLEACSAQAWLALPALASELCSEA